MSHSNEPKELRFIDWFSVASILDHVCTSGVRTALLFKRDGVVISAGGNAADADVVGALMMNIWEDFSSFCTSNSPLDYFVADCENGQIAAVPIGELFLCLLADRTVQPGMFHMKVSFAM